MGDPTSPRRRLPALASSLRRSILRSQQGQGSSKRAPRDATDDEAATPGPAAYAPSSKRRRTHTDSALSVHGRQTHRRKAERHPVRSTVIEMAKCTAASAGPAWSTGLVWSGSWLLWWTTDGRVQAVDTVTSRGINLSPAAHAIPIRPSRVGDLTRDGRRVAGTTDNQAIQDRGRRLVRSVFRA